MWIMAHTTTFKTLILASAIMAAPAAAQEWTVGDQGVNWDTLSTKPVGSAPADAYEPADPGLPVGVNEADWLINIGDQQTTTPGAGSFLKGPSHEKKIRITCEPSTVKIKDNILGKGIAKFGHPHQGYGSITWDENTDYASLRADPQSTCTGGPLNATNYMEPAVLKQLDNGVVVAVLAQSQADYYVRGVQSEPNEMTWLRRGMQFLVGANPKDFNDTARRAAYAASSNDLVYPGSPDTPAGFRGWYCNLYDGSGVTVSDTTARMKSDTGIEITNKARYLKGPNGEDPFGGNCTGTEAEPAEIVSELAAPGCWDRHNLTAPDGRGHFWYFARNSASTIAHACPTTASGESYAEVPALEVKNLYSTTGFSDYGEWYLESDRMDPAMTVTAGCSNDPETQGDSCSKDPCRKVGPYFCNGATLHADYTYGWSSTVFDTMQRECLGITVRGIAPVDGPAECNGSQVDRYHKLIASGAPADSTWIGGCTSILNCNDAVPSKPLERYEIVPEMMQGSVTIEHRDH